MECSHNPRKTGRSLINYGVNKTDVRVHKTKDRIMKIKTIDIIAREWFDRVNGNSYFAAQIILNYCMRDEVLIKVPFQYGYGNQYEYAAKKILIDNHYIVDHQCAHHEVFNAPCNIPHIDMDLAIGALCQESNIILRSSKIENCLKVDVKRFGGES